MRSLADRNQYGYRSEHKSFGQTDEKASDYDPYFRTSHPRVWFNFVEHEHFATVLAVAFERLSWWRGEDSTLPSRVRFVSISQVSARRRGRSAEGNRLLHFPRWMAPINWGVALPLGHVVLPWWISLHLVRHGWSGGLPGGWNLIAILPVSAGLAIIVWALGMHFVSAEQGWKLEMTPSYLLVRGPYRFTRNPMYVAAIAIWFGWTVFYGSAAVLVGLAAIWIAVEFAAVPFEERRLEERWGDAYREYRRRVPRWIGSRAV